MLRIHCQFAFAFLIPLAPVLAAEPALKPTQKTAIEAVQQQAENIKAVNQALWRYAEVGLQESQSSQLLMDKLQEAGFEVKSGLSGMSTAFVASYEHGSPVIGVLAEYDALPGMSQRVAPQRRAAVEGAAGHACGHSGLGSGALGAVLAVGLQLPPSILAGVVGSWLVARGLLSAAGC